MATTKEELLVSGIRQAVVTYRRGTSVAVTDLVLSVLRLLRRDLSELASSMELVDLYNEG